MTDSLKAAHEAIDDITSYHGRQKAHAALDAAVEEARGQDAVRSVDCEAALAAERERGRREAFDMKPVKRAEERIAEALARHQRSCPQCGPDLHWIGCEMARILRGEEGR